MRHPVVQSDLEWLLQADLPWNQLAAKTVLISGAAGFVPAYLVETLLCLNEQFFTTPVKIIGVVKNFQRVRDRFATYGDRNDLHWLEQDICQPLSLTTPIDYIIHAASPASPRFFGVDPIGVIAPNIQGTEALLRLAWQQQTRGFLFISSSEIYGRVDPAQQPIREDTYGALDPLAVRSCYAEAKRLGETLCGAWHHQHQVPAKIARLFHTYGPGMRPDDGRVQADFVRDVVQGQSIVLKSDGTARRSFCYLRDAVLGCWTVLLRGDTGQAYNVGDPAAELSIGELADRLVALFPEKSLRVIRQSQPLPAGYLPNQSDRVCPDIQKLQQLGWSPQMPVMEGFRRTISSFWNPG